MNNLLEKIAQCIEFGKINRITPYPPEMNGQDGADELTKLALENNISPEEVLNKGLIEGMNRIGKKFVENKVYVPQMLLSARAMNMAMQHIKPFFQSGEIRQKGTFIIGTVAGDLHEIGKNIIAMAVEGNGWKTIDLGVDVKPADFLNTLKENPAAVVGLSALLTTTMVNMKTIVSEIKADFPETKIIIGGAPINDDFRREIGADFYSPNPQGALEYLNEL